jgi:pyridoxine 5-phosphate synthase
MNKKKLGINIDHVATIRNARGEIYPEPLKAALLAQKSGADSVTIHLREDRRHIKDIDLKKIKKKIDIPLNLEIAPTKEMLKIALINRPDYVCIVPEKRREITTEGGLNVKKNKSLLKNYIYKLKQKKIRVSLFIEANKQDIIIAKKLGADCVEIHTGKLCDLINKKKSFKRIFDKIEKVSLYAKNIGLEVHAGHGLTYKSALKILKINSISELNIGHFVISEAIFVGLGKAIREFKKIINKHT